MDEHLERQYLDVELYEKTTVRERRKKGILISSAFILFLFLCAIPVYREQLPKWQSLQAARMIGVEIEKIKTEALHLKKPLQISILSDGLLKVEVVSHCRASPADVNSVTQVLREYRWTDEEEGISLLNAEGAKELNLNMAVQQLCFDPVLGILSPKVKKVIVLAPVKDLAELRLDRASYVEVETSSARISIN